MRFMGATIDAYEEECEKVLQDVLKTARLSNNSTTNNNNINNNTIILQELDHRPRDSKT